VASPIVGPAGNHEYVLWLAQDATAALPDLQELVAATLG
jgi:23S rRNA (cytidine1920-2'-O)/16S rRNA (cytidine1409-2'-O)-methyltransferase